MNRRDFLVNTTAASVTGALAISGAEAFGAGTDAKGKPTPAAAKDAQSAKELQSRVAAGIAARAEKPKSPVNCAVIGLGEQGSAILGTLNSMNSGAPIVAICDTYKSAGFLKKVKEHFHNDKVAVYDDYKQVLDDKSVQAVFIATPTHKHKQIALDAIAAGKHVYLEAPIAVDLEEARAITKAGMAAKTIYQPGLQMRSNMQYRHVMHFIKGKVLGELTMGRSQWHLRNSWRRVAPNDARQAALNWRLSQETSNGLMGEVGIHQLDVAGWYLGAAMQSKSDPNAEQKQEHVNLLPLAISGNGGILGWKDGRDTQDTVQCVLEYPGNLRFMYDATLTNGFDGVYDTFYGTASAVQLRDQRAWMFKEDDANPLGWETFARKDALSFGKPENGTGLKVTEGIALVADATKQIKLGLQPGTVGTDVTKTSLYQSLDGFLDSIRNSTKPWVTPEEGYQATVLAAKVNEACLKNTRIEVQKEWFVI